MRTQHRNPAGGASRRFIAYISIIITVLLVELLNQATGFVQYIPEYFVPVAALVAIVLWAVQWVLRKGKGDDDQG